MSKVEVASVFEVEESINLTPEEVDKIIANSQHLRRLVDLRFTERQIKEEIEQVLEDALNEFQQLFSNQQHVKGQRVDLTLSYGPTSWEFSSEVKELEKQLKKLKQQEKANGKAIAKPSQKQLLKVKIKDGED